MDQTTQLLLLIAAAALGITATLFILRRQRRDRESLTRETPYAVSSEGQKRCPNRNCVNCGKLLPG